jgi:hypothetical protein
MRVLQRPNGGLTGGTRKPNRWGWVEIDYADALAEAGLDPETSDSHEALRQMVAQLVRQELARRMDRPSQGFMRRILTELRQFGQASMAMFGHERANAGLRHGKEVT